MRRYLAVVALAGTLVDVSAGQVVQAPGLAGLWGATRSFGPEIRGELTLRRAGNGWRAEIGGTWAPAEMAGSEVRFALAGNKGSFRGRREADGIRGHWIQPAGPVTGVSWATAVALRPAGLDVWRGIIVPLEESVTLYIDIRAEADGKLFAVLRNPDGAYRNGRLALAVEGSHLKFSSINSGAMPSVITLARPRSRVTPIARRSPRETDGARPRSPPKGSTRLGSPRSSRRSSTPTRGRRPRP